MKCSDHSRFLLPVCSSLTRETTPSPCSNILVFSIRRIASSGACSRTDAACCPCLKLQRSAVLSPAVETAGSGDVSWPASWAATPSAFPSVERIDMGQSIASRGCQFNHRLTRSVVRVVFAATSSPGGSQTESSDGAACRKPPSNATCLPVSGRERRASLASPQTSSPMLSGQRMPAISVGDPKSLRYVTVARCGMIDRPSPSRE